MDNRQDLSFSYFLRTWMHQSWDLIGPMLPVHSLFFVLVVGGFVPAGSFLAYADARTLPFLPWGMVFLASLGLGLWCACWGWLAFHRSMRELLSGGDPVWSDFFQELRAVFRTSIPFFSFLTFTGGVLAFNLFVYPTIFASQPALRLAAMTFTVWMLLFLGMVQVHLAAFLAIQEAPFRVALKRAVQVAFWAPFRSLLVLGFEAATAVLFFPPLCFILPGMAVTANTLHLMILLEDWKDPYERTAEASPKLP